MTRPRHIGRTRGVTMGELAVVVAVVFVIWVLMSGALNKARNGGGPTCASNLKQIGVGLQMFANDSGGKFPVFNSTNEAWQYFQSAGDNLCSPKILLCPADKERYRTPTAPIDFQVPPTTNSFASSRHQNNSLSYFYGVDSIKEQPGLFLAGDRNLLFNDKPVTRIAKIHSESPISWTKALHGKKGGIVFVDGSVRFLSTAELRQSISLGTNKSQRLILP